MKRFATRVLFLGFLISSQIFGAFITHEPAETFYLNQPYTIEFGLDDLSDESRLKNLQGFLYFRETGRDTYTEVLAAQTQLGQFSFPLVPSIRESNAIEYYVEIRQNGAPIATFPEVSPRRVPIRVPVVSKIAPVGVRLLSPEPGVPVKDSSSVILFGLSDEDNQVNLKQVKLFLNSINVSRGLNRSRTFLSFIPSTTMPVGDYDIKLILPLKNGKQIEKSWSLALKVDKQEKKIFEIRGNVQWNSRVFNTNKNEALIARESFEAQYTLNTFVDTNTLQTHILAHIDNRDNRYTQPLNRFSVRVDNRKRYHHLQVGDSNPRLSKLSFNGRFLRGIDAKVDVLKFFGKPRKVELRYIGGETQRAVAISTANNVLAGSYRQTVTGYQTTLRNGRNRHSLTYLHFMDDLSSLNEDQRGGSHARENHVFSLHNQFRLFDVTQINWETAGSIFYSNIESAEVPLEDLDTPLSQDQLETLTNIFPARSSLLFGFASHLNVKTPLPIKGMSAVSDIKWTQPGFTTLGNTGIRRDNYEQGGYVNYRLLGNDLNLRLGLRQQNNNILEKNTNTTYQDTQYAQASYRLGKWGAFNMNYNHSTRENRNAETNQPVTGSIKIENALDTYAFSYNNLPIKFWKLKGTLNSNLTLTSFDDTVNNDNNFSTTAYSLSYNTDLLKGRASFGFNESNRAEKSALPNNTIYTTYSVQYSKSLFQKKLSVFSGLRFTFGNNTGSNPDRALDTSRQVISFGGAYKYTPFSALKNGRFSLSTELIEQVDNLNRDNNTENYSEVLMTFKYVAEF